MSFVVVGGHRVREGREDEYLVLMGQLRDLLRREGRGLRYWAVARSVSDPRAFGGVAVWSSRDDERRMVNHPERLELVETIRPLLAAPVGEVVGPVILELEGDGTEEVFADPV
jgi:heme-degrading monooxygenase HmoA